MRRALRLLAVLVLLAPASLPAQEPAAVAVTRGTVRDAVSGTALVGAEVSAIGTRGRTWTDNRGHFRLETTARPDSLRIISIGYAEGRVGAGDTVLVALERLAVVLPELVTTGGRWTTRIAEDPAPITTVQSEEIVSRGVTAVDQVVAGLPGVQVQPTQPAGTSVSIRGIGEQRVLVLIDGEPAPGVQLETIDLSRLSTYDAERVEVTKGPTSSEYGSDALGGVINIVSRGPPRPFTVDANVSAGNLGRRTADAALGGTSGRLGARMTASVRQLDWAAGVADSTSFERVWNVGGTLRYAASSVGGPAHGREVLLRAPALAGGRRLQRLPGQHGTERLGRGGVRGGGRTHARTRLRAGVRLRVSRRPRRRAGGGERGAAVGGHPARPLRVRAPTRAPHARSRRAVQPPRGGGTRPARGRNQHRRPARGLGQGPGPLRPVPLHGRTPLHGQLALGRQPGPVVRRGVGAGAATAAARQRLDAASGRRPSRKRGGASGIRRSATPSSAIPTWSRRRRGRSPAARAGWCLAAWCSMRTSTATTSRT